MTSITARFVGAPHRLRLATRSCSTSRKITFHTVASSFTPGKKLDGRVAIITGGASGIGATTAKLFASQGAKVVVADIQDEKGSALVKDLGPNSRYFHCDVSCEDQVSACVEFATSTYGKTLDIMFNNAGVVDAGKPEQAFLRITDIDASSFDHVCSVNVKGTLFGVKHAAKAMISSTDSMRCILNMCSISAVVAQRTYHSYTISKHAIIGITKTAASELGRHGIRVNCISPVGIITPLLTKLLQKLQPTLTSEQIQEAYVCNSELAGTKLEVEDVANAALFLCSQDAKYISGHNLVLDGGLSASRPFDPFRNPYE
ncbi:momilactone A synthase [Selaginella moellendorffii]|uniref:momilactone A synthase n=1 Tax=Selaginella moellendorffii TaxID=88036 RepID=UPI000D1D0BDE|nr:momilactone A synthase [Selaginella moellendorffii]|eukprot:XP_002970482.2 momilactone A synthase [Selaginella moellendorffii]